MVSRPCIPLYKVHMPPEANEAVRTVLDSGYLADGEIVRQFEAHLRDYLGNPNLITVGEESSAIVLALYIAGVRPGDEVLASPMACLATNMPILNLFAGIVWCDVDPDTGNLDPAEIERRITPRAKAVVYAHWAGVVADVAAINWIARRHGLRVVEDASEALGAEYDGRKIGNTDSDFTVFSFHAIRHINTGEGAAITFADPAEAEQARWLKRYGIHQPTFRDTLGEIDPASDIPRAGYNSYMNNISAAIGLAQMGHVEEVVGRHRENGEYYDRALADLPGLTLLKRLSQASSACWVYTFLAERRDDLLRHLRERGVFASKVHLRNDVYSCFGTGIADYSGVNSFSSSCLSIPSGWWVSQDDREFIVDSIRSGW